MRFITIFLCAIALPACSANSIMSNYKIDEEKKWCQNHTDYREDRFYAYFGK